MPGVGVLQQGRSQTGRQSSWYQSLPRDLVLTVTGCRQVPHCTIFVGMMPLSHIRSILARLWSRPAPELSAGLVVMARIVIVVGLEPFQVLRGAAVGLLDVLLEFGSFDPPLVAAADLDPL